MTGMLVFLMCGISVTLTKMLKVKTKQCFARSVGKEVVCNFIVLFLAWSANFAGIILKHKKM